PAEARTRTVTSPGDRKLRMRFEAPVARYRLERDELAVVNVLRAKPPSVPELLNCGLGSDERIRRIVYALCMTRPLDLGADLALPVGYRSEERRVGRERRARRSPQHQVTRRK